MSHQKEIRSIVSIFCARERPQGKKEFLIHGPFDSASVLKSDAKDRPGCYAIYDANGKLRYIGMSDSGVGYRARCHFTPSTQASDFWKKGPADTIDLIEVEHSWEAPSLEAYLTLNTVALRT